jgi:hypothetical protein
MIKKECCKCGKTELEAARKGIYLSWKAPLDEHTAFTCVPSCDTELPPPARKRKHQA